MSQEKKMAEPQQQGRKPGGSWLSRAVHVEEVSGGPRPIEAVGTAVAAFVGLARRHPVGAALGAVAAVSVVVVVVRALRDRGRRPRP
ncbi:hypothetical protein KZX45_03440 [Georgenia sp. EYE_87]|uniref:hypothetical protein n=1 Tax=Georgenia sp. EYE_87 TaxID=2853448 RepID=UPI002004E8DC|nr:hypothetical protein [Georgenia sp. EYE_87]MCK6209596.1 hypothetical protein [Georgenia sp. EYE_87]